jgi:hypothetical protein
MTSNECSLSLKSEKRPKMIRATLEGLVKQIAGSGESQRLELLGKAYDDAMKRITQEPCSRDLAVQVLSWITCAKRPLTTTELQHALTVEPGDSELGEDDLLEVDGMVAVCADLVTVDEESGIIRLVHFTTQEYFQKTQARWFPTAEQEISMTCITYLSFSSSRRGHALQTTNSSSGCKITHCTTIETMRDKPRYQVKKPTGFLGPLP